MGSLLRISLVVLFAALLACADPITANLANAALLPGGYTIDGLTISGSSALSLESNGIEISTVGVDQPGGINSGVIVSYDGGEPLDVLSITGMQPSAGGTCRGTTTYRSTFGASSIAGGYDGSELFGGGTQTLNWDGLFYLGIDQNAACTDDLQFDEEAVDHFVVSSIVFEPGTSYNPLNNTPEPASIWLFITGLLLGASILLLGDRKLATRRR